MLFLKAAARMERKQAASRISHINSAVWGDADKVEKMMRELDKD